MNEKAIDHADDSVLGSDVSDEAIEAAADTERARQQMSLMVSGPVGYPDFCC
jgi:hypothetical protein